MQNQVISEKNGKYRKDFLVVQLRGRAYKIWCVANDPVMEEVFSTLVVEKI